MDTRKVGTVLCVGVLLGATVFSTLQARQSADRAAFQALRIDLPVTDVGRSVEFYRTVLEFEPANVLPTARQGEPSPGLFSVGGQYLGLRQGLKEGPRSDEIRLTVQVADPGEYAARLRARGVAVNVEFIDLNRQPAFTVLDPDGYRFYFYAKVDPALLLPPGRR